MTMRSEETSVADKPRIQGIGAADVTDCVLHEKRSPHGESSSNKSNASKASSTQQEALAVSTVK